MDSVKIITVEKSRDLENRAHEQGLSFAQMMENAGQRTAEVVRRRWGVQGKRIVVLVGPGNNGGDGLVAAHHLYEMGAQVTCYLWKRAPKGDPNFARVQADSLPMVWAEDDADYEALQILVSNADVVIDALLGVGVSRPIEGTLKELLDATRSALSKPTEGLGLLELLPQGEPHHRRTVLAVDCPSGLDCDSGALDPAAIHADVTVTFAHPKVGLLRFPGAEAVGDLVVADIGIPAELADDVGLEMVTENMVRSWLPIRPRSAHKGTFGRALLVAGSVNYVGAAALAGCGTMRVGAGLVTMGLPLPIQPAVAAHLMEATYLLLPHDLGVLDSGAVAVLQENIGDYGALLLGPGLTQEEATVSFVHALLGLERAERKGRIGFVTGVPAEETERPPLPPLVVDADGLNAISAAFEWWKVLPPDTILTPHPGEMARLMGGELTIADIQADREAVTSRMAKKWGTVVLLKGAFSVVGAPDGRVVVLPFANPGLATAGTGDVLAGAITGLRAQGLSAFEAAVTGAYLHGLAGELTRAELGSAGMVAGDLLSRLPLALRLVRQGR